MEVLRTSLIQVLHGVSTIYAVNVNLMKVQAPLIDL
jgi:hypothetical protein